jgi:acyl carrier protein
MNDVIAILNDIRPGEDFSRADDFFAQGLLDSVDLTSLVAALEARYELFVDVAELVPENFRNLVVIKELLARHGVAV